MRKLLKNGIAGNIFHPPRSPTILGKEILISDWNVVGKCDTTPSYFSLFATAMLTKGFVFGFTWLNEVFRSYQYLNLYFLLLSVI